MKVVSLPLASFAAVVAVMVAGPAFLHCASPMPGSEIVATRSSVDDQVANGRTAVEPSE